MGVGVSVRVGVWVRGGLDPRVRVGARGRGRGRAVHHGLSNVDHKGLPLLLPLPLLLLYYYYYF